MAAVLLALVVLGFLRTFFLRPWFDTYEVVPSVLWHGVAMTLWFVWYLLQATLVGRGNAALHRRLGWAGAVIGAVAVCSAVGVNFAMVVRGRRRGRDIEAEITTWSDVIWSNLAPALVFALCLAVAIALRRRREVHSRLMLVASLALVDPALARIELLPDVTLLGVGADALVFTHLIPMLLPLTLVGHDLLQRRRLHAMTVVGISLLWIGMPLMRSVVPTTRLGQQLVLLFS